jgi:antitoxin HicB
MASSGKRKRRRLNDLELAAETRVNTREDSANEGTNRDKAFDHSGSTFDSFLEEEGIRGEVEAIALKRVLAWQLEREMQKQHKTKLAMARELHTSRSQLDRLLHPANVSVSLDTIARAARALGKRVTIRISDVKVG